MLINNLTLGSHFRFKNAFPMMSHSSIIDSYVGTYCGAQNVGSTARTLFVRSSEHSGKSYRTGLPVFCPKHSAIRSHSEQVCNAAVSNAAFSIVDSANDDLDLRILESIYIHDRKPIFNDKDYLLFTNNKVGKRVDPMTFLMRYFISFFVLFFLLFCLPPFLFIISFRSLLFLNRHHPFYHDCAFYSSILPILLIIFSFVLFTKTKLLTRLQNINLVYFITVLADDDV